MFFGTCEKDGCCSRMTLNRVLAPSPKNPATTMTTSNLYRDLNRKLRRRLRFPLRSVRAGNRPPLTNSFRNGPASAAEPIRLVTSVHTPLQIRSFDSHFPKNWTENQRKLRRKDRANSERSMQPLARGVNCRGLLTASSKPLQSGCPKTDECREGNLAMPLYSSRKAFVSTSDALRFQENSSPFTQLFYYTSTCQNTSVFQYNSSRDRRDFTHFGTRWRSRR